MAWSTPRTWVDGEVETAAILNAHIRDNLNAVVPNGPDGWISYTPTLTQTVAVTKTVSYAKYMKVGRLVTVNFLLAVTGSGTAATAIKVGLPVTAAYSGGGTLPVGFGAVYDQSAGAVWKGEAILASTADVQFRASGSSTGVLGSTDMTLGLANLDTVEGFLMYESAT